MSYQVLARKWRPRTFEEVVGQTHVVRALVNALDQDRIHHAFLFTGTRGVGKTTVARIFAKCLNCETGVSSSPCGECASCREVDEGRFIDLLEVDAASRAKVDETRELMDNVQFAPARGRYKVYLIDEVHMFSGHSFNALLKTLEEPPPHVKFLLATTDPQKLPVTVLSRCLQFNLKRLPADLISGHLEQVLAGEGVQAENEAVLTIADAADGSLRDALSLVDQAIAHGGGQLAAGDVAAMLGRVGRHHLTGLLKALGQGDGKALMGGIDEMAAEVGDFDDALSALLSLLQKVAVAQAVPQAGPGEGGEESSEEAAIKELADTLPTEDVQLYYQIGVMGRRDLPYAPDPRAGFEMSLLRMLAFRPAQSQVSIAPTGGALKRADSTPRPLESKAPSPPSPPPPPPSAATRPELSPQHWPQVVAALALNGLPKELAANSVLTDFDGETVRLLLAPAQAQLSGAKIQEKLAEALQAYVGGAVNLRIEVGDPEDETPARRRDRESDERQRAAVEAIENDPNVQALQERFGAKLDQGGITPVDGDG
ncbi:MAG: DNA polymerase III subunit gamma/tau [Gammaproteobacteria bacterium]|nr:MAG: DNA polymerase III subunit gamma/tau [Gammaproteobacteria bacterium]